MTKSDFEAATTEKLGFSGPIGHSCFFTERDSFE